MRPATESHQERRIIWWQPSSCHNSSFFLPWSPFPVPGDGPHMCQGSFLERPHCTLFTWVLFVSVFFFSKPSLGFCLFFYFVSILRISLYNQAVLNSTTPGSIDCFVLLVTIAVTWTWLGKISESFIFVRAHCGLTWSLLIWSAVSFVT